MSAVRTGTRIPKIKLPPEARDVLEAAPKLTWFDSKQALLDAACGGPGADEFLVAYDVPGKGSVTEATVARVRNGIVANYPDPYMRRRDPDCMTVADDRPTNKVRFKDRYGYDFAKLRQETFDWLKTQELSAFAFVAGQKGLGFDAVVIAPANAGFFSFGLALLQGITPIAELSEKFDPQAMIYIA